MTKAPTKAKRVPLVPGADRYSKYVLADIYAIKGVAAGTANAEQMQRALQWIVESAAQTYHTSFNSNPYEAAFNEGRRFVGLEIVKFLKLNPEALKRNADGTE